MLRVKDICKAKGIKMSELAKAIGTTPSTLSQSLKGKISLERLKMIADYLNVSITELFEEVEVQLKIGNHISRYKKE